LSAILAVLPVTRAVPARGRPTAPTVPVVGRPRPFAGRQTLSRPRWRKVHESGPPPRARAAPA